MSRTKQIPMTISEYLAQQQVAQTSSNKKKIRIVIKKKR